MGLAYSFRGFVYYHGREHGSMHGGMVLEKNLRVLPPDPQVERKPLGLALHLKPTPKDTPPKSAGPPGDQAL